MQCEQQLCHLRLVCNFFLNGAGRGHNALCTFPCSAFPCILRGVGVGVTAVGVGTNVSFAFSNISQNVGLCNSSSCRGAFGGGFFGGSSAKLLLQSNMIEKNFAMGSANFCLSDLTVE